MELMDPLDMLNEFDSYISDEMEWDPAKLSECDPSPLLSPVFRMPKVSQPLPLPPLPEGLDLVLPVLPDKVTMTVEGGWWDHEQECYVLAANIFKVIVHKKQETQSRLIEFISRKTLKVSLLKQHPGEYHFRVTMSWMTTTPSTLQLTLDGKVVGECRVRMSMR